MTSERRRRHSSRGFTLLEMLVVLLVAGMALVLTSQALGQYQRAHTRAIASERTGREQRMGEAWFRASVRGLHAVGGDAAFAGTAEGFEGVTLAPVLAAQGAPVAQRWRVVAAEGGGERLELQEGDRTVVVALPRSGALRFHYLDADGELHDRWPPALGIWTHLPAAVVLELEPDPGIDDTGTLVASAVLGPRDPIDMPYEYSLE